MKGKRALVTGGTGFIGGHLTERLLAAGAAEVVVAVAPGEAPHVHPNVRTIEVDIRDAAAVDACSAVKADVVFHLAGFSRVGESFLKLGECFDVNAKGTALLVEAARDAESFVYASSAEVYGSTASVPLDEGTPPSPDSPYAIAKLAGEHACFARQRATVATVNGTRFAVLRLFNVFGPGQRPPAVVAATIGACVSGAPVRTTKGEQTRDFLYVDDAVDALIAAAERAPEGPINVCSGRELAIRDLVAAIARLSETQSSIELGALPYRAREVWRVFGNGDRAARLLGFRPRVSLEDGLARTIAWARGQPASAR